MCVCVYMYVEGRELFTGRWRRGAVNSTVKKLGRRRTLEHRRRFSRVKRALLLF